MTDYDDTIRESLGSEGPYAPAAGESLRKRVVQSYDARLRRVERISWAYVCATTWVALYGLSKFIYATDVKAALGYAVLILFAMQVHAMIKLWYWIMNGKLGVLREVKLVQAVLHAVASATPGGAAAVRPLSDPVPPATAMALPKAERFAWIALIAAGAGLLTGLQASATGRMTHDASTSLDWDRPAQTSVECSYKWYGLQPLRTFPYNTQDDTDVAWYDRRGRRLPATGEVMNGRRQHNVMFIDPVGFGETVSFRQVFTAPPEQPDEHGVYTHVADWTHGLETSYTETVWLPSGAELVSVTPEPDLKSVSDSQPVLVFRGDRAVNERFRAEIRYKRALSSTTPG